MSLSITNYGGTVVKLLVPERAGKVDDVVLGFDNLDAYLAEKGGPYFGATIGRYGNRIAEGQFSLDGHSYQLATNDRPNALHGGKKGFDKCVWNAEIVSQNPPSILLSRTCPDGEEGYPGTVKASVRGSVTDKNELKFYYSATTDKPTIVNLTHHNYFNLGGEASGNTILDELLTIKADGYTPVDSTLIPTGEIKSMDGTPFDFRKPTSIGARIQQVGGKPVGYDHNYVLTDYKERTRHRQGGGSQDRPHHDGFLRSAKGAIYSGNFLDGTLTGKGGTVYQQYDALALEPQHFPDSPNEPKFPSVVLNAGHTNHSTIIYAFSVAK